jgi:hypothetical protein
MYIYERNNWTDFHWDASEVSLLQEKVFRMQGLLYGRLSSLGFDSKLRAMAENLTYFLKPLLQFGVAFVYFCRKIIEKWTTIEDKV